MYFPGNGDSRPSAIRAAAKKGASQSCCDEREKGNRERRGNSKAQKKGMGGGKNWTKVEYYEPVGQQNKGGKVNGRYEW